MTTRKKQSKLEELEKMDNCYNKWEVRAKSATQPEGIMDQARHLWDQYKNRHELIWSLLFKFTAAVVALSILPYSISFNPCERFKKNRLSVKSLFAAKSN